jgi:hypothetical protein
MERKHAQQFQAVHLLAHLKHQNFVMAVSDI